jgi:hypothetical protein
MAVERRDALQTGFFEHAGRRRVRNVAGGKNPPMRHTSFEKTNPGSPPVALSHVRSQAPIT